MTSCDRDVKRGNMRKKMLQSEGRRFERNASSA